MSSGSFGRPMYNGGPTLLSSSFVDPGVMRMGKVVQDVVALAQRIGRRLDKGIASAFFIDQWVILTARRCGHAGLQWKPFTPLLPPKDRYWGDPFVVHRDGTYYVFIEEKLYGTGRGRIACLTLDAQGSLLEQEVVLEREYHLSYPFIFDDGGELFMIPESAANRSVDLYRCTRFPSTWQHVQTLMTDVYAVDATLLGHEGRYWLFANVKERGGSSLDSLHIYHATDLQKGPWTPHPRNPVVKDISSARPAGRIFLEAGQLIRPSQDSSRRYGYALKFNRITQLSETEYSETTEAGFSPAGSPYRAVHTFNEAGDLTAIDAVLRRRK